MTSSHSRRGEQGPVLACLHPGPSQSDLDGHALRAKLSPHPQPWTQRGGECPPPAPPIPPTTPHQSWDAAFPPQQESSLSSSPPTSPSREPSCQLPRHLKKKTFTLNVCYRRGWCGAVLSPTPAGMVSHFPAACHAKFLRARSGQTKTPGEPAVQHVLHPAPLAAYTPQRRCQLTSQSPQ